MKVFDWNQLNNKEYVEHYLEERRKEKWFDAESEFIKEDNNNTSNNEPWRVI